MNSKKPKKERSPDQDTTTDITPEDKAKDNPIPNAPGTGGYRHTTKLQ